LPSLSFIVNNFPGYRNDALLDLVTFEPTLPAAVGERIEDLSSTLPASSIRKLTVSTFPLKLAKCSGV
jgi:hypothetical protein